MKFGLLGAGHQNRVLKNEIPYKRITGRQCLHRDFITPTWPTSPSNSGLLRQFSLGKVQKDFCFSRYSGGFRYLPYLKPKIFQSPISNTMNMGPNFLWVLLLELEAKRQL